jgi:ribosomal protein S18 acetylase RimI-like enzyme
MYSVRSAQQSEIPRMLVLLKESGLLWEMGDTEKVWERKLAHDNESIVVLEYGNEIIGMAMFTYDPWASFLWHLCVVPQHQGRGLARLLAEKIARIVRARGTTTLCGYVHPENDKSLAFCKKNGATVDRPVLPVELIL